MRWLIILLLIAGCDRLFNLDKLPPVHIDATTMDSHVDDAGEIDARMIDGRPDAFTCGVGSLACSGALSLIVCGGFCFQFCTENISWADAQVRCSNAGATGRLATLDTGTADNCVATSLSENAWIGLAQPPNSANEAAGWGWTNATPLSYTHWAMSEPNDSGDGIENNDENCGLKTTTSGGVWNDVGCTMEYAFVCQL